MRCFFPGPYKHWLDPRQSGAAGRVATGEVHALAASDENYYVGIYHSDNNLLWKHRKASVPVCMGWLEQPV